MKNIRIIMLFFPLLHSCVEPFDIERTAAKSYIVIEATITDENKEQQVLVSRTFPLDTVQSNPESNATVTVSDSNGSSYAFIERENGRYVSATSFAAVAGRTYTLSVRTADGNSYTSEAVVMPPPTEIAALYASREFKDDEEEGIFIFVDSYDPSGNSKYYRYEYEETYKIIAPYFNTQDAYVVSYPPNPQVALRPRQQEEQTCFNTLLSKEVIQTQTTDLGEDRVTRFPVRFISRESAMLRERYSILVKQYVQSREAYEYYETLSALSGSESLFTQIQPGFLEGNIRSDSSIDENVIGYFQLNAVAQKRIFFNYNDFFQGERLPDYEIDCFITSPLLEQEGGSPLIIQMEFGLLKFWEEYDQSDPLDLILFGPYLMVTAGCGDCTVLGSNVVPDFWQE